MANKILLAWWWVHGTVLVWSRGEADGQMDQPGNQKPAWQLRAAEKAERLYASLLRRGDFGCGSIGTVSFCIRGILHAAGHVRTVIRGQWCRGVCQAGQSQVVIDGSLVPIRWWCGASCPNSVMMWGFMSSGVGEIGFCRRSCYNTIQYNTTQYNFTASVNAIARGMFCGAKYTHHTFTPIIKHHSITTANKHPGEKSFIDKNMKNPIGIKLCISHKTATSRGLPLESHCPNKSSCKNYLQQIN